MRKTCLKVLGKLFIGSKWKTNCCARKRGAAKTSVRCFILNLNISAGPGKVASPLDSSAETFGRDRQKRREEDFNENESTGKWIDGSSRGYFRRERKTCRRPQPRKPRVWWGRWARDVALEPRWYPPPSFEMMKYKYGTCSIKFYGTVCLINFLVELACH